MLLFMVGLAITILRGSLPSPFPAAAPFFISKSRCSRSMPFFQRLAACSLPMPFFQRLLRLAVLETFFSKAELKVAFAFFPKAALFPTSVLHACLATLVAAFFPKASMHLYCKGCLAPFFQKGCCQCAFFQRLIQLFWVSSNLALKATASGLVKPLASICFFISAITFL